MKKILLSIISVLILTCAAVSYAYETALINFPPRDKWIAVLHQTQGAEAILQYVPEGQSATNWTRTLIFHSYKSYGGFYYDNAAQLLDITTAQLEYQNGSGRYKYLKYDGMDSLATRCVKGNSRIPTQCEFLRTTKSYEGLMSMHYINKNIKDFRQNYTQWLHIIRTIRIYRSYYRDNRIMDKEQNYEL